MSKFPVLVLAFNRVDHVLEAMNAIREYKPERIYLECDGTRPNKKGEKEAVEATRKAMFDAVDWPCEVKTLFRDKNMGCANAVYDAISWFFKNEEYGIICEDDIVLSADFFRLCEDLLLRYKNENRVMEISARNESFRTDIPDTYVYAQCYHCWGWATWRRAWKKMDMQMKAAPKLSRMYLVKRLGVFRGLMMKYYFMKAYHSLPNFNSWATRWYLSILAHDGLVICPGVNLAINIEPCAQYFCYRRALLIDNSLFFKEGILHEDSLFTPITLTYCKSVVYFEKPVYHHFIRSGSITQVVKPKRISDLIIVTKGLVAFGDTLSVKDRYRWGDKRYLWNTAIGRKK